MIDERVHEIQDYYNSRYANLGDGAFRPSPAYLEFLDYLEAVPGKRLLDVGSGNGFLLAAAEQRGLETYGMDISKEAVALAARNAPKSSLSVGRAETLPYQDGFFDYVTCLGVLEHTLDIGGALDEMYRVTRADARVCIMVPNANYLFWRLRGSLGTEQVDINEQLFSLKAWRRLLHEHRFVVRKVRQDRWGARHVRVFADARLLGILRRAVTKLLWTFMPAALTYQIIFICDKR